MNDPASYLPLGAPVFHILLALGQDRLHGYGIMQAIEEKTEGRARILPGTLYTTLNRMIGEGMVEHVPPPEGEENDPRRRYYRVTELGLGVIAAESERMATLLAVAKKERLTGGSGPVPGKA